MKLLGKIYNECVRSVPVKSNEITEQTNALRFVTSPVKSFNDVYI